MNDEAAFLAAIIADPDDDTVRLAFADWLQEHDDPARAAFIRLRVKEPHVEDRKERETIARETHRLYNENKAKWLADLPPDLVGRVSHAEFVRGFLTKLKHTAAGIARIPNRVWSKHPIQELTVDEARGKLDRVLAMPQLNRIRQLFLHASTPGEDLLTSDLEALAACPNLTGMRYLALWTRDGNATATALARCPSLRSLDHLSLDDDSLDEEGIATLTQEGADNLRSLKKLSLEGRSIGPAAAEALAGAEALAKLETLFIRRSGTDNPGQIGDDGAAALASSPHMGALRFVWLEYQSVGPRGARALAETRHMTKLQKLHLDGNPLGAVGVRAIVHGPWPELTELRMDYCGLQDDAAAAIAHSGRLTALTELDIKWNRIGDRGAEALSRARWLAGLTRLNLHENPIGDKGALALCEGKTLASLQKLRLKPKHGKLSPAVAAALAERFGKSVDSRWFE